MEFSLYGQLTNILNNSYENNICTCARGRGEGGVGVQVCKKALCCLHKDFKRLTEQLPTASEPEA